MDQGFFDHVFFWVFVGASLLTAIDWAIGPDGRSRMRERVGLWWLHVSETTFAGLVAEDAARVEAWLRRIFGRRWLGLRAMLLCLAISVVTSLTIWLGSMAATVAQAEMPEDTPPNLPYLVAKAVLGFTVTPEEVELGPEEAEIPPDERAMLKDLYAQEIRVNANDTRRLIASTAWSAPLVLLLINAVLDWVSLGVTLLLLGWMARAVSTPRLLGIVLFDLFLAILLALTVGVLVFVYAVGPSELMRIGIEEIEQATRTAEMTLQQMRAVTGNAGIWEGMIAVPLAILFTSALPTLVHLLLAVVFLASKLFRPLLQPLIGRVLYLFHVSQKGVLTQIAVGGAVLIKAGQETLKYLAG